jgi:8-oxo-dGTP pyrophosphatase MutT (NUDIX family)
VQNPSAFPFVSAQDALPALHAGALTVSSVSAAFKAQIEWRPDVTGDQFRARSDPLKRAAVLLALVPNGNGLDLLLTQRTTNLREHSGQIALPGGRVDASDASDEAAALREAFEEVGLPMDRVSVLGQLNRYVTGSGFDIAPVVGIVNSSFEHQACADEVAEVFYVPLSFLMDPENHRRHTVEIQATSTSPQSSRTFYSMQYQQYFIWGATAAMLRNFYRMLAASTA